MTHSAKRVGYKSYEYRGYDISYNEASFGGFYWFINSSWDVPNGDFDPATTLREAKKWIDILLESRG